MGPVQIEEWIPKGEAAKILGVSTRQIERLAARGLIRKRYVKPGIENRYGSTLFQGATILAMTTTRQQSLGRDCSTGVSVVPVGRSPAAAQADAWAALATHLSHLAEIYAPPLKKCFLTFAEAIEYSGHTPAKLAELLHSSQVDNYGRGPKTWRVRRASLDAYGEGGI